jgi:putative membrane protein
MRGLLMALTGAVFVGPLAWFAHLQVGYVPSRVDAQPFVVAGLVVSAALYDLGLRRLWRRGGIGVAVRRWEAACFLLGWLALVIALVSPLDRLSDLLLSAHMVQHELLMLIAAPLLVLARPPVVWLWALPPRPRRSVGRAVQRPAVVAAWGLATGPIVVWVAHGLALWLWHLPGPYQAALRHEAIHAVQHLSFFGTAALFWWSLVHGRYGRAGYGIGVVYVFTTAMHSGVLGALLTLAPSVWYRYYEEYMWIPAGVVFLVVGLALFAAWLGEAERRGRHATAAGLLGLVAAVALVGAGCRDREAAERAARLAGGDPERGRASVRTYGCDACHDIPGTGGMRGLVGPPLERIGARVYLAGRLPNTPENMIRWIRHPQEVQAGNAMPDMRVTEHDAQDIAAYLYTLQ